MTLMLMTLTTSITPRMLIMMMTVMVSDGYAGGAMMMMLFFVSIHVPDEELHTGPSARAPSNSKHVNCPRRVSLSDLSAHPCSQASACHSCRESCAYSSSSALASQKLPPNTTGSDTTNRQRHLRLQALTAVTTFTPRASDKESPRFERGLHSLGSMFKIPNRS